AMAAMPVAPAQRRSQNAGSGPSGLTTPTPVTTTFSGTAEHHRRVVAAEAVRVRERVAERRGPARPRHEVEIARGIRILEVHRRREEAVAEREDRRQALDRSGRAERV